MSVEKVKNYLNQFNMADRVLEFDVSSATVELAAAALNVEPARIAKTISVHSNDGCILIVTAGDTKIDNRKFKDVFHFKAKMLTADEVLALTGHAVGGVCPFALPENTPVFLDSSLKRFDTVYPAAGSASSAVKLSCDELELCSGGTWADICSVKE